MMALRSIPSRRLLVLGSLVLLLGVAWTSVSRDDYVNGSLGFTMTPPKFSFGPEVKGANVLQFYAPPSSGFAANLGLRIQRQKLLDFCSASDVEFKDMGLTVISSKDVTIGKAAAREYLCRGKVNKLDLEFLFVGIAHGDETFVLTGTALEKEFEKTEPAFRAAIQSFKADK